jgi:hypothetical protein
VTASWVDRVKTSVGLKGVSQVWGDKPAWYCWISGAPGAYHLQMEDASTRKVNKKNLPTGLFSIKCYPFPQERVFHSFSFEEQCFIRSDFFDHTNTPRIELKERIPVTLFNVATMEYTVDPDDNFVLFTFEALDVMRIRYEQETVRKYAFLEQAKCFGKGEIGRNVAGWELGYQLFDRLLSLYSFYSKQKPVRVLMTSSPGFEYVYDRTDAFQCVDAGDIKIYSLGVLFASESGNPTLEGEELIAEQLKEGCQEMICDRTFRCGHFHHSDDLFPLVSALNEQWWSLAEVDYKSELASSCGCP